MARRKGQVLDVPETAEEARAVMVDYIGDERGALRVALHYEMAIDKLKAERDAVLAGIEAAQKPRFAALKAWWEAGGHKALGDTGRSSQLAGAKIGIRLTPPKVKFPRGIMAEGVVAWLKGLRWSDKVKFLRTKTELDKQAVIKAVLADAQIAARFAGMLTVEQTDEFFIDAGLDEDAMRKALSPDSAS